MTASRFSSVVILVLASACGPAPVPLTTTIAVTAVGTPNGPTQTAMIGPAGGSVSSSDGLVTLTVPANAVTAMTAFTVTPVEATGPGALRAFRLGPEGTRFAAPATVTMKYSAEDVAGSAPELFTVGSQDAQGRWRGATTKVDENSRTISAETTHLSDWSFLRGATLRPPSATVKVKNTVSLEVKTCRFADPPAGDDDLAPIAFECQSFEEETAPILVGPSVNGVRGGNASLGTVGSDRKFQYTAPAKKPTPNPVSVSIEYSPNRKGKTLLVSNVTVTDETPAPERYTGTFQYNLRSGGAGTGSSRFDVIGNSTVTIARGSEGSYAIAGMFQLTGGFVELATCDCSLQSGSGPLGDGRLFLVPSTGKYTWRWGTSFQAAVTCTQRSGTGMCPTSYLVNATFDSGDEACEGTGTTTFTAPETLTGAFERTCRASGATVLNVTTVSWNFAGQQ